MDQALNKNDRDWAMYGHAAGLLSLTSFHVVSCIRGAVAASKGEPFTYPFSIELVR